MLTLADDFSLFVIIAVTRDYGEAVIILPYRDSVDV